MKLIKTEDAVGHVLCHDITQIIKGVTKDAVFRKGHVVKEEDIPVLLSVGKENLYVWEKDDNLLHENEAAEILYAISADENMHGSDIKEGKIELIADVDGVLMIDRDKLRKINSLGQMMIASRHGGFPVKRGDKLAGTRVIPLVIAKEKMEEAKSIAGDEPIFKLAPYKLRTAGVVTTGSEVFKNRIEDTFTPVIVEKLAEYGIEMTMHAICSDDHEDITAEINKMLEAGVDMILCTGGMSVDPDDRTPLAIKNAGTDIVTYGAPVLPGAMFLLSYKGDVPVMGLPGCVMYARRTIFDLVLPRVAAGVKISQKDLAGLGEGGLCLSCEQCTYPNCGFGKGV
ncbi:MAG: molybdopterin-binding protein [Eubacterium sp.]|nr:molybdopterin-binding protein [Candidatus Colimonas fimequi]